MKNALRNLAAGAAVAATLTVAIQVAQAQGGCYPLSGYTCTQGFNMSTHSAYCYDNGGYSYGGAGKGPSGVYTNYGCYALAN